MAAQTIYMMNGRGADPAILKGLLEAGCDIRDTHSVAETLNSLRNAELTNGPRGVLLVAEVQAGAIPLLTLLRETGVTPPPTLLFDHEGSSIQAAIKALQLGVQEYILASESPGQRELRARVMAERILSASVAPRPKSMPTVIAPAPAASDAVSAAATSMDFQWDPESHVIYIENKYIRLSPVEGRVFDMLVARHNKTVSMEELLGEGMRMQNANVEEGIKLLRPHMMRLRNKLERHPRLAHRIVNVRGNGYMFI